LLLKSHSLELFDELRRQLPVVQLILPLRVLPLVGKTGVLGALCDSSSQVLRPTRWALVLAH
jgi:hypothetical protein